MGAYQTRGGLSRTRALVGFDGTVDKIVSVVDKRVGAGDAFEPIPSIQNFGVRIASAAGKSTNMELFLRQEKVGGNAAIMAGALAMAGVKTTLVADLGLPKLHPVFNQLARRVRLKSLGNPTETHALEFGDGKIMLCYTRNHEAISLASVEKALGGRGGLKRTLDENDLVSMVNWTMTPNMTAIWRELLSAVLQKSNTPRGHRKFFFDLADPEKRSVAELKEGLEMLAKFEVFGEVVLGMNLRESQQTALALGLSPIADDEVAVRIGAQKIRERLGISRVAIHLTETAFCATAERVFGVTGPHVANVKIRTGAGDHFNAGFAAGLLLGVSPVAALVLGVAFSGHYVATATTPGIVDVFDMIKKKW